MVNDDLGVHESATLKADRRSDLIAPQLLVLSSLVRRSANLVFEAELGL